MVPRTGLSVDLLLRGEHHPPHVHVEDAEAAWEARFEFSFLTNIVRLIDVDPLANAPTTKAINRVRSAIIANLMICRLEWWEKIKGCCLDNKWVIIDEARVVAVLAKRRRTSVQIQTAHYAPASDTLTLIFKDGTRHHMRAGSGEEA